MTTGSVLGVDGRMFVICEVTGTKSDPIYRLKETATGDEFIWDERMLQVYTTMDYKYPRSFRNSLEKIGEGIGTLVHSLVYYAKMITGRI